MKAMHKLGLIILLWSVVVTSTLAQTKQPGYHKKGNWVETILHNRNDLMKNYVGNTFQPFRSQMMRYRDDAQKVELDVTGIHLLYLSVDPTEDGAGMDHAAWGNARFIKADGSVVEASQMKVKKQGWSELTFDQSLMKKPISINGKVYKNGMMMHAYGFALLDLGGEFVRFEAEIGVEQNGGNKKSSIIFAADDYQMVRFMNRVNNDYPIKTNRFKQYAGSDAPLIFGDRAEQVVQLVAQKIADKAGIKNLVLPLKGKSLKRQLIQLDELFNIQQQLSELQTLNGANVREAFHFMKENHGDQYLSKVSQEARLLIPQLENERIRIIKELTAGQSQAIEEAGVLLAVSRQILLSNPLLHGKEMMVLRQKVGLNRGRSVMGQDLGYPKNNWTTSAAIPKPAKGWNNELAVMKDVASNPTFTTLYQPSEPVVINDPEIHWDGQRILFSSVNKKKAWHLFEINRDGSGLKQLTPDGYEDIGFFDGCYLPNGKVAMVSTAPYQGVPCIGGGQSTGAVYELNPADQKIRQLNFGQDNDWNPIVLNNGRLMYLRWEYTDASHYFTRILMSMNPDGTGKKEYYGSNSYFPNSMFEARSIPQHPTKFVTIVSGHHGTTRSGRLMVFDPGKGRHEADGVVQEIPFKDRQVEPIIKDRLVDGVWPQFLAPYPLDENFFLVTAKLSPEALWGIYLVDVFDNMTLIAEQEGEALMYPM
ncbi:MAG: NPCBM/NEW2 domain-containing protein, partial [Marinilabiliaceae bacterium]|nr:NPCBM/NEW2 domain-containing protein [Marinilabiliaceae bacterium]